MESLTRPELTSGKNLSFWVASHSPIICDTLGSDLDTDVVIVGGGISGLTTAYCLASSGKKVVVVEDGYIGSGESGRTTAHITYALDDRYYHLEKVFGEDGAKKAAESHKYAIDFIEEIIQKEDISCNFLRINGYLFLNPTDSEDSLDKEYLATRRAGLPTDLMDEVPQMKGEPSRSICFPSQAQFHIMCYLDGLVKAIKKLGGQIFTNTKAEKITKDGIETKDFKISAKDIVVATNTPVNDWMKIHTKQAAYRSYVIAAAIPKNKLTAALWWDTGNMRSQWVSEPYHYVRLVNYNDQYDLLISGGEDHKTGQADNEHIHEASRYSRLEAWTREYFPDVTDILYRWSGQVMEPADSLAFIGKNPGDDNIYIITGDSGNGMTHGTLGGIIITDLINGKENRWADLYSPSRSVLHTFGDYAKELGNAVAQFGDYLSGGDIKNIADLVSGQGAIYSKGINKYAVYRDDKGDLSAHSAICPHLGCIVRWNNDEKTFDCPCHGSRFTTSGVVVNGPAVKGLTPIDVTSIQN